MPAKLRMNVAASAPEVYHHLMQLEELVAARIEPRLLHLLKLRASQINGCAYCIHMHTGEARRDGESEERLYLLDAWRESPLYTDRERAALAWTEAVTLISETHAPDDVYEATRAQFDETELVKLTMVIVAINAWNRIAISFRTMHPVKAAERAKAS